jgi:hypothetical protein
MEEMMNISSVNVTGYMINTGIEYSVRKAYILKNKNEKHLLMFWQHKKIWVTTIPFMELFYQYFI